MSILARVDLRRSLPSEPAATRALAQLLTPFQDMVRAFVDIPRPIAVSLAAPACACDLDATDPVDTNGLPYGGWCLMRRNGSKQQTKCFMTDPRRIFGTQVAVPGDHRPRTPKTIHELL